MCHDFAVFRVSFVKTASIKTHVVDMEHLFKIFQNHSNIIQHKSPYKIKPYHGNKLETYGYLQNQPQCCVKLALSKNCKNGTILAPPQGGLVPLQNQDHPSCHMSTYLP